jgi:hypothetical protein
MRLRLRARHAQEAAFLPTDLSANPDLRLLRALRSALARGPGSLLAVISSPHARKPLPLLQRAALVQSTTPACGHLLGMARRVPGSATEVLELF